MTEQGLNSTPTEDSQGLKRPDDDFIIDDAWPVCPKCLKPCHPLQYYCDGCDSNDVINPLTPYIGFVNIRFNYGIFLTMWRKVWYEKDTSMTGRLFYLFMITMFVPIFLIVGLPTFVIVKSTHPKLRKATIIILCIVAAVLFIFFVFYKVPTGFVSRPITIH